MARKSDPLSDSFESDDSDSWLGGIVADENGLDRQNLWRLGLWGFAAVGALTLGILSGQLPVNAQRTHTAANELAGRALQVETAMQESRLETRRLAAAIETLNSDRDRLFSRLSNLEQGLDVVTGSIKKADDEKPAPTPWPDAAVAPVIESAPAVIVAPAQAPPQPAAAPPVESAPTVVAGRSEPPQPPAVASQPPSVIQAMPIPDPQPAVEAAPNAVEETAVAPAEFAVDLGAANSIQGLRALWRGLVKSHKAQLDGLRPLIAVRERRNGLGLQLRLIAGPIKDAATVARICAVLSDADRNCATAPFDGQRLSLAAEPEERATPPRPAKQRKSSRAKPQAAQANAAQASSLSSMLGFR